VGTEIYDTGVGWVRSKVSKWVSEVCDRSSRTAALRNCKLHEFEIWHNWRRRVCGKYEQKKFRVSPWILKFLRICVRKRTRPQSAHLWCRRHDVNSFYCITNFTRKYIWSRPFKISGEFTDFKHVDACKFPLRFRLSVIVRILFELYLTGITV